MAVVYHSRTGITRRCHKKAGDGKCSYFCYNFSRAPSNGQNGERGEDMKGAELNLEALVETCGDRLLRLCTLYLGEVHLAEDAVQDTFLKALRAQEAFRG